MSRKVHPIGFRLKINKTWDGRWFAEGQNYVDQLHQDFSISTFETPARGAESPTILRIEKSWCSWST